MSCFFLENLQSSESLFPPSGAVTETQFHFSLEERTLCCTTRALKTGRTPFLLLTPVGFCQMNMWKWALRVSPSRSPPAAIPKRFPEGAHGCSPCTAQPPKTCSQVCGQPASSSAFHCRQLSMVFPLPVCFSECLVRLSETSLPLAALCQRGFPSIGAEPVSICAVFGVPYLQKRTKIGHPEVANCPSLNDPNDALQHLTLCVQTNSLCSGVGHRCRITLLTPSSALFWCIKHI